MQNIITTIGINKFVKRQIKGSGKTYAETLTFTDIVNHAQVQLSKGKYKLGYRKGVLRVDVANNLKHHFICPFVKINENTKLKAQMVRRRPEEKPYVQVRALNGDPMKTNSAELILYHHDVLSETNEENTALEWELISFHAIPENIDVMPMGPITMMRNQLQLPGGTKAIYTSEEWAYSVKFWQELAILEN